ncbi:sensor histidine kinase [Microbacterium paraoxydans]|uniref:sensor histidine kinase n=1 Tax=Microbacterium paraoxydans TaxID=199592 RepID=UPI003D75B9A4
MSAQRDPDAEKVRRAARVVAVWVGVSSGVIVLGGVLILLAVVLSSSRREGERHEGGGFPGAGGDDFVVDISVLVPAVVLLGAVGVLLLAVVASIAARRAALPLSDALRRQRQFVADASHELRTPLTALTSRIQILQRRLDRGEDVTATARELREDADRMRDVLSDMLLAAEGQSFAGESAVLADAARGATAAIRSLADDTAVRIDVDVVDAVVPVLPVTLVRALVALLDNAVAHSPAGGSVELSARRSASGVEIRVTDHGAGISGIDPAQVFERFARSPDSGRGRGFGIGLSLVRDVAQRAGGSVVVESTSPGRTVFLLTLPTTTPR